MTRYLVPAAAVAFGLLALYAYYERAQRVALAERLALKSAQLETCGGRLKAVLDDARSDREIDNLPDDALRVVPPEWLRPDSPASP